MRAYKFLCFQVISTWVGIHWSNEQRVQEGCTLSAVICSSKKPTANGPRGNDSCPIFVYLLRPAPDLNVSLSSEPDEIANYQLSETCVQFQHENVDQPQVTEHVRKAMLPGIVKR